MNSQTNERPGGAAAPGGSTPPPANPARRRAPSLIELGIGRMARGYLRRDRMGRDERARVIANLFHEGKRRTPFMHRFAALMVLSSLIAVLGLLADSTAVVIGAMIVAPLMAPVLGLAAALVMDWPRRAARAAGTAALGSILCVVLAVITGFILPTPEEIPSEILARTAPNLLDLGVAVIAGSAGAYAQVRRAAGEALTGVAVAVALVPPLSVLGLTLQMGEWTLAAGATLLFFANVAGIVLSAAATFVVCGFVPQRRLFSGRINVARSIRLAMAAVLLVLAPLELSDQWRERRPINEEETRLAVRDVLAETHPHVAVIAIEVGTEAGERTIDITASTTEKPIDVEHLATNLGEELDVSFELEVTTLEAQSQKASVDEPEPDGAVTVAVEEETESLEDVVAKFVEEVETIPETDSADTEAETNLGEEERGAATLAEDGADTGMDLDQNLDLDQDQDQDQDLDQEDPAPPAPQASPPGG